MSLRMFKVRHLAVLLFASLAVGTAPARADEAPIERAPHHVQVHHVYHPRPMPIIIRRTVRVPVPYPVPVPVQVPQYTYSGCGGCGAHVAAPVYLAPEPTPEPVYLDPAPAYSGCGGCGSAYVAPAPVYSGGCGGCGSAYVAPAPVYSGGCGGCGAAYAAPAPLRTAYCSDVVNDGECTATPYYHGRWPYRYGANSWSHYNRSGCAFAAGRWYCR